ncbi:MAG: hypothetical protein WDW38_000430 [Sanguina aurantia]
MAEDKEGQAIMELFDRVQLHRENASKFAQQDRSAAVMRQRTQLTLSELAAVPEETRVYKSIGKAYFHSPMATVVGALEGRVASCDSDLLSIRQQRDAVEKKLRESDKELQELIRASAPDTLQRMTGA